MSEVKFSFEGELSTLVHLLSSLVKDAEPRVELTPAIVPRSVTEQLPPRPPTIYPAAPTMERLRVDPVYGGGGAQGPAPMLGESAPAPTEYPSTGPEVPLGFDFASLPLDSGAWKAFCEFVGAWLVGFDSPPDEDGNPSVPQPDRLNLLKGIGSGRWSMLILRWCAHYGSLQGALHRALALDRDLTLGITPKHLDLVDRLSANITQLAHAAFPDIAGFHDYSTKWSRDLIRENEEEQAS